MEGIFVLNILIHKSINTPNIPLVTYIFILHFIKYLTTFNKQSLCKIQWKLFNPPDT